MREGSLVGHSLLDCLGPEQLPVIQEKTRERQAGKEDFYELWIRRPDGTPRLLLVTVTRELDAEGRYLGSVGVFKDITERRRAEDIVRASEARFRALIEQAPMAVAITRQGEFLQVNRRYLELHGFPDDQSLIGQPFLDRVHPEDLHQVQDGPAISGPKAGAPECFSFRSRRCDGAYLFVRVWARSIELEDGIASLGFFEGITRQREAELEREQLILELTQALLEVRRRPLARMLGRCSPHPLEPASHLIPGVTVRGVELNLGLEPGGQGPLYRQVADRIVEAILGGQIQAGMRLPGVRELARRAGVHPNTVLVAMRDLEDQGWVRSLPRSGFFICEFLPSRPSSALGPAIPESAPGFEVPDNLAAITSTQDVRLDLSEGMADARMAPMEALVRAYHRALNLKGTELLGAGDFKGHHRLREALALHLNSQRALAPDPEQILVLRSTSMAVSLVAQTLLGPRGGHVAVENPGNPMVWETLRQVSATTLHGIPVDQEGLRPEALEVLLGQQALSLLVLSPQCQFPTGVGLSSERRRQILDLSRRFRFPILELDPEYDHLPGTLDPPRPLAAGNLGQVFYVGSLSRLLAPGIRASFLVVPLELADPMAKLRQRVDWQGDAMLEWALSELFLDGEILRHLRRVRKAAQERRDALEDALRHVRGSLPLEVAPGAMGFWLKGEGRLLRPEAFEAWILACRIRGLKLRSGSYFDLEGRPQAATRLGFTAFTPEELQAAVASMAS